MSVPANTDNDEECEPSTSSTINESQQDEPSTSSVINETQQGGPSTSSTINESQQDDPSTSSTIIASQQDGPSANTESQQDMTEEEQMIQTADTAGEIGDKSSSNELIKSIKKNASKLKEIGKKTVFCKKVIPIKEKIDWEEIIRNTVTENLQCGVCMEIFIKPTVLNCSHTFCESCIHIWMRKVKKCPMCRVNIQSKSYCLTLDSFIDKLVEYMPEEIKLRRRITVKERTLTKDEEYTRRHINRSSRLDRLVNATAQSQHPLLDLFMATSGNHNDDIEDDIEENVIRDQSEVMRMNLHDIVISTRGMNPLLDYNGWCE